MDDRTMLLDQRLAAEFLSVSTRTLEGWRLTGGGPKFVRLSKRAVRYRLQDLERFVVERLRNSTSDTRTV
jgi:hypothetical protein